MPALSDPYAVPASDWTLYVVASVARSDVLRVPLAPVTPLLGVKEDANAAETHPATAHEKVKGTPLSAVSSVVVKVELEPANAGVAVFNAVVDIAAEPS